MGELLKYIKNNPAYAVVMVGLIVLFLYVLYEEVQPLIYLLGATILVGICFTILNIKGKWH
jgi:uncharacterized membrane protein